MGCCTTQIAPANSTIACTRLCPLVDLREIEQSRVLIPRSWHLVDSRSSFSLPLRGLQTLRAAPCGTCPHIALNSALGVTDATEQRM